VKKETTRELIKQNSEKILQKSKGKLEVSSIFIILRTLKINSAEIFNFNEALKTLSAVCGQTDNPYFLDIKNAIAHFYKVHNENNFLKTFPIGGHRHKSGNFLINNEQFAKNQRYGLFAGINSDVTDRLSLIIDENTDSYHPILTFGLFGIIVMNRSALIDDSGVKTLCENLKQLASNKTWKEQFTALIRTFVEQHKSASKSISINVFFNAVENHALSLETLCNSQKRLIKQLSALKINVDKALMNGVGKDSNLATFKEEYKLRSNDKIIHQIYTKPKRIDADGDEDTHEDTLNFLKTIGTHRTESQAQNILFSNNTLLPHEIRSLEATISKEELNDDNQKNTKIRLCHALMLYYSIPLPSIPLILMGTPELDYTKEEMDDRIVIDTENDRVYLPTPIQKLQKNNNKQHYYKHLPLPLEVNVKRLLHSLSNNNLSTSLTKILDEDTIQGAKSFNSVAGFRQYRITAKKVSQVLCSNVLSQCHDEVKTAYLQGGAYEFIHMGCYYTQLSTRELNELYLSTCQTIFEHCQFNKLEDSDDYIGSQRIAEVGKEVGKIHEFLYRKSQHINQQKKTLKTTEQLWDFHNEFAMYTLTTLNLSTTHRPHLDPYYSINNFIENDFVQITEKVISTGFEGRIAVLSSDSKNQFEQYLKHLENLSKRFLELGNTSLSGIINAVLEGKIDPEKGLPLFFFVQNSKIIPISKKIYKNYYQSIPGLEMTVNFYRHVFSSVMGSLNTPRLYIAAQMGHVSKGLEPYSLTNELYPLRLKEEIQISLDEFFKRLELSTIKAPHIAKYQTIDISNLSWHLRRLGPFYREEFRKTHIDSETMLLLDTNLEKSELPINNYKVFIDLEKQAELLKVIKNLDFKRPQNILLNYLEHKKTALQWKIETRSKLSKTPFGKNYGIEYHHGKSFNQALLTNIQNTIAEPQGASPKSTRILLALSALVSGSVIQKEHLLEISNSKKEDFQDIRICLAIDLKPNKIPSNRTWLLNSISASLLNQIREFKTEITESDFNEYLKQKSLPLLPKLISNITAYKRLYLPSRVLSCGERYSMHNSIGVEGYAKLLGNYSNENNPVDEDSTMPSAIDLFASSKKEKTLNPGELNNARMKELSSLLGEAKRKKIGHLTALKKLKDFKSEESAINPFSLVEQLLIEWVELELQNQQIAVSSITTYFSKIHAHIWDGFKDFKSIDEFDDNQLKNVIYPSILNKMKSHYDDELPKSALSTFHAFLAFSYDFQELHFASNGIQALGSIQPIILEAEYQACLEAVDQASNCDQHTSTCLKLCLILYKRTGLRLMEVFKLKPKDICLTSKTIHITGNHIAAEKSSKGNRILPYSSFLKEDEIKLLEQWKTISTLETKTPTYFLFDQQAQQLSHEEVTKFVTKFLEKIIRSVTGKSRISIKSFRKSFASETFVNLTLHRYDFVAKLLEFKEANLSHEVLRSFNSYDPNNIYWLLANWMGHSSPLTTFEYYALTKDLEIFLITEEKLQSSNGYNAILESFDINQELKKATYRNLNRSKSNKFAYFFANYISEFKQSPFKTKKPSYTKIMNLEYSTVEIQKVLTLFLMEHESSDIDKLLLLKPGSAALVIQASKDILKRDHHTIISDPVLKHFIKHVTWVKFNQKQFTEQKASKLTKQTIENGTVLNTKEIKSVTQLWLEQLYDSDKDMGIIKVQNDQNLVQFLTIYNQIHTHESNRGYLLIEVHGIKNNSDDAVPAIHEEPYVSYKDKRVLSMDKFPEQFFILKLSTRSKESKRPSNCKLGFDSIVFFIALKQYLKEIRI
jgi:integrase